MKTIEEMLRNLARPEVLEFGLVSNRLPSVNIGGKFEPVDDKAPNTDAVLEMLVAMGGSRYVESLSAKPTQWTTRLDGVGVVAIAAIMRDDVVQARFTVARREPAGARPSQQAQRAAAPVPADDPRTPEQKKRDSITNIMAQRTPAAQAAPAAQAPQPTPQPPPQQAAVQPAKHPSDTRQTAQRGSATMATALPVEAEPPPPPPFGDDDDNEPTVQTFAPGPRPGMPAQLASAPPASAAPAPAPPPPAPAPPPPPPAPAPPATPSTTPPEEDIPRPKPARTREAASLTPAAASAPPPQEPPARAKEPARDAQPARVHTGTVTSLQQHRAAAQAPAPPPSAPAAADDRTEAAGRPPMKRIDTPTGFVLVENPAPRRAPEPEKPPAPPPLALEGAPAGDGTLGGPLPQWEWEPPQQQPLPPVAEKSAPPPQRFAPAPPPPAPPPPSQAVATIATGANMSANAPPTQAQPSVPPPAPAPAPRAQPPSVATPSREPAPPTPTVAQLPDAPPPSTSSGRVPSTELAPFGTIDSIGDEPSVERAVILALPREGNIDVDALLAQARADRASDVHLAPGIPPMVRIGGELRPLGEKIGPGVVEAISDSLIPASSASSYRREGGAFFVVEHKTVGRLRVHVSKNRGVPHVSLRFIPDVSALGALELPPAAINLARAAHGLVLVTSPKGQGSTTTAAAIVDAINESSARRIVVIDSPIEFLHARKRGLVTHVQVGVHASSYASAVSAAVKADADVIAIGDIQDVAAMRLALSAAEEGRLVIATMKAKSTARAVERLVESFPVTEQPLARAVLASVLRLVLCQRLVPAAEKNKLHSAQEVLPASVALYTIIRDANWSSMPTLMQKGKPLGVIRLEEALAELVKAGDTAIDLARVAALNPQDFDVLVGARAPGKKG